VEEEKAEKLNGRPTHDPIKETASGKPSSFHKNTPFEGSVAGWELFYPAYL
jgi:hypothetical protein